MTLRAGTKLGCYEVTASIGAGGMGEVYRARDTKLDRDVAIKILPESFAHDPERVARFQREARVLASLNHPNIAAIYGFEESQEHRFLVLELAEGETLTDRLRVSSLPVDEALDVCRQIAEALEDAHEHGIIHRDLKPANVKVAPNAKVKVLDFGLAKAFASDPSASNITDSPTITARHTRPGVVLGTAAYMSPEQARGKPLDKRTDIWSFGCVLYECLTGERPFGGETTSDVVAKILERDPNYEMLPGNTPQAIRSLLHHCLEKDRKRRLRDIGDAVVELEETISTRAWSTSAMSAAAGVPAYEKRRAAVAVAAVLLSVLGAVVGAGLWHLVRPSLRMPVSRTSIVFPPELKIGRAPLGELSELIRLSPDGQTLAFIAQQAREDSAGAGVCMIYTRRVDRYDVNPVKGTEHARGLTFSPNGRWLAFVGPIAPDSDKQRLAKVPVDGRSPPLTLTDWCDEWNSWMGPQFEWLPGGDILVIVGAGDAFTRIPSDGGAPSVPVKIERREFSGSIGVSSSLPDNRTVLLNMFGFGQRGWQTSVALLDLGTAGMRVLIPDGSRGAYAATGHLLFSRGETLLAAPFDVDRLVLTHGPVAIMAGLRTSFSWDCGDFEIARNGTLAYPPGGRVGTRRRIVFVDREGNVSPWSQERRAFDVRLAVSANGQRIAAVVANAMGVYEIWTSDVDHRRLRRFAAVPDADCANPAWSPDGDYLAYSRVGKNKQDGIYWRRTDGTDEPERLASTELPQTTLHPLAWSPNGSHLLVQRWVGGAPRDVLLLSLEPDESGERALSPVLADSFNESGADFSPDGKWITYSSDESGRDEVYVRAFHADGTLGPAVPVTTSGGSGPIWSRDGTTIFYRSQRRLMVVEITPEAPAQESQPREALDFDKVRAIDDIYSVLPDGRLVVFQKGEDEDEISRINVVLNWFEELKRRVPLEHDP